MEKQVTKETESEKRFPPYRPGDIIGNFTVLKYLETKKQKRLYELLCVCGKKLQMFSKDFRRKSYRKTCGCKIPNKAKDRTVLIGQKFGLLEVSAKGKTKKGLSWVCKCSCGNDNFVVGNYELTRGSVKSCGCLRSEMRAEMKKYTKYKDISIEYIARIKTRCQNLGYDCDISIEDIWDTYIEQGRRCFFTGIPIGFSDGGNYKINSASIDRIDSSKGYLKGNICLVHKDINFMKQDFSVDTFLKYCDAVVKRHLSDESNLNAKIDKVIIIVPVSSSIEAKTDESLRKLEKEGYRVDRVWGWSAIDQCRNALAQKALDEGYEHIFWIDSDVDFNYNDVKAFIRSGYKMIAAPYCVKGWPALTTEFFQNEIELGEKGSIIEVKYAATGFLYTHKSVYETIINHFKLEKVKIWGGMYNVYPYFLPSIVNNEWLGEDFAFCSRAREAGIKIYSDTRIKLGHIGKFSYSYGFLSEGLKDEPLSVKYTQKEGIKYG